MIVSAIGLPNCDKSWMVVCESANSPRVASKRSDLDIVAPVAKTTLPKQSVRYHFMDIKFIKNRIGILRFRVEAYQKKNKEV